VTQCLYKGELYLSIFFTMNQNKTECYTFDSDVRFMKSGLR